MTHEMVQVGTGGQGAVWCEQFLPPYQERGDLEVVAAVDVDPDAHEHAQAGLGLSPDACYTDVETAFAAHPEADFCTVVVPPWAHEEVVDAALAHDLDVLSEKPIADTLAASVRIAEKVERAGAKMGVTMSHRFDRDKTTLRRELRADSTGDLDYLVGRFTCDARDYGDWGAFRHDMDDPLLVEGAVHQLDFLADMAGGNCETVYADTWRPEWAEYAGDCQALVQMRFDNGVRVAWEGAKANAVGLNGWTSDYVRAEARDATLVLNDRTLVRHPYRADETLIGGGTDEMSGERVPLLDRDPWMNEWLIEQFLSWLDGGEPMETNVSANLQSVAMVEAAIESSETGDPVAVQDLLAETRADVRASLAE
jgi:predicted dehydrogenase